LNFLLAHELTGGMKCRDKLGGGHASLQKHRVKRQSWRSKSG